MPVRQARQMNARCFGYNPPVITRSTIIILALIGIAVFSIFTAVVSSEPPKVEKIAEPVLSVRTIKPQRGEYAPALFLIGRVEARDYATLTAPVEANVRKIAVREGEYFRAGKQLLSLDRRELSYAAQIQEATLDELRTQLSALTRNRTADEQRLREMRQLVQLTENEHERNVALHDKGVIAISQREASQQRLLQKQLELTAMKNQVADYETQALRLAAKADAATAQLQQTQLLLERAALRAPFAGRVAKVHTAIGARPAKGAPLLDIFDPARLRLRVALPQRYIGAIKDGKETRALLTENDTTLTLTLARIEPQVAAGNSGVDVFFKLPAGDWVLGAVRDITVELPPVSSLVVPVDAIYNDEFVYRVDGDERAEAVRCQRRGLTEGDDDVAALVTCPDIGENDTIIANQLPNILSGVKLTVIHRQ